MNKTAIKNYAIWARVQLIESAKQKAYEYEITENGENNPNLEAIGGRLLSKVEKEQRQQLIAQIQQKGYTQVMEEAAYTWFNRFIALRFMEVNGYLPSKVRVFTDESNAFKPEILKEAMSIELDGLDRSLVLELLDKQDNEALFKYLLIIQCNALNVGLPYMFEKIANWTELLFPVNLLRVDSVIGRLISDINVGDWNDEVEIIGWFYQYYISEKHDAVVDPLHGKVVAKEDIPAATQLFTTDWVVRYILDNSLGRYWIERHPESKLAEKLTYFVTPKDGNIPTVNESISPDELKILDPCVGSGHFLSYAFDILMEIYREYGWSDRDAAKSIIENNLYGLDIDDRAVQLACFAVMMKARKYNRRIINSDIKLHILAMQDSTFMSDELIQYIAGGNATIKNDLNELCIVFNNAKEYGSIINAPLINYDALYSRINEKEKAPVESLIDFQYQREAMELLFPLIQQVEILSHQYDIVVTNPPYLNRFSPKLKAYLSEKFSECKSDLFSVFMLRNYGFCKKNGYSGFLTPNVWMFLKTYEMLRNEVLTRKGIVTLVQMAHNAFSSIAAVDVCAFVLKNGDLNYNGLFFRLTDQHGDMDYQNKKLLEAIHDRDCGYYFEANETNFFNIPGAPLAYWVSNNMIKAFQGKKLFDYGRTCQGFATGDNNKFLRLWFEVGSNNIFWNCKTHDESKASALKWYPCTKGGAFRRWYGNMEYVVNWQFDGKELTAFDGAVIRNPDYYFLEACTWSTISSGPISLRYAVAGSLFESKGAKLFIHDKELFKYILGIMNSPVIQYSLSFLAPTMDYHEGPISRVPIIVSQDDQKLHEINEYVDLNVALSKKDWDSFETSWDFQCHPLAALAVQHHYKRLSDCWEKWEQACVNCFNQLKANEEELNRIFIDIYGLQDELTPFVADKDVTVRKADINRDIRSLISYAVGCMMGRYSLDKPGLAFAGGAWDASQYASYQPDRDGILPITDDEYFDDDIVGMLVDWVRTVYGKETLEENLKFIANALGGKGMPRELIRNYFLNDFYADHLKIYQKRPIYWLFSSGKKNGFKCLIYMHRYQPDLLARLRTDYVHEQQERYRTQSQMAEDAMQTAAPSERVKLNKRLTKLKDQALELQKYEEKIHHLADQFIRINLDDGVKLNYELFREVLAKIG